MQTLSTCAPPIASSSPRRSDQIPDYIRQIYTNVPQFESGPGGRILTGPVAIRGAEIGDLLEVRIKKIHVDAPCTWNRAVGVD